MIDGKWGGGGGARDKCGDIETGTEAKIETGTEAKIEPERKKRERERERERREEKRERVHIQKDL